MLQFAQEGARAVPTYRDCRDAAECVIVAIRAQNIRVLAFPLDAREGCLRTTRCKIAGAVDQWFPNNRLLAGPRIPGLLASWEVDCEGIYATPLTLPASVSSERTARLLSRAFRWSERCVFSPAGLPMRGFDGEGQSE
jgi:hypothetical protein